MKTTMADSPTTVHGGAYEAALSEILSALPALPGSWSPKTVQHALRKALLAYERAKEKNDA